MLLDAGYRPQFSRCGLLLPLCTGPCASRDRQKSLGRDRSLLAALETRFFQTKTGFLVRRSAEEVSAGNVTWVDRYQFHQLVNQSTENCVTLHLYSPARQD
ncbi:MAG: hypothetical protein F6J93_08895 [Oscillatoria sp. SIO1A7]|nr:hypothetical protein [Oscillatoria sp. SIO1A7]